jgi:hypothetical protein
MLISQFMVPTAAKASAGSKRQLTARDSEQDAPAAKASRQQTGRSWIDWQMSDCKEPREAVLLPWREQVDSTRHQFTARLAGSQRACAESLLANLIAEDSWRELINTEGKKPYFSQLESFLKQELDRTTVYPPRAQIFRALNELPVCKIKVVIIGQVCIVNQHRWPITVAALPYATLKRVHYAGPISWTRASRRLVL